MICDLDLFETKKTNVLRSEFCQGYFKPTTIEQLNLLERFLAIRIINGEPSKFSILRNLVKTKPFTKSIYPPNWRIS